MCQDLGLSNLPAADPTVGHGVFQEIPLKFILGEVNGLTEISLRFQEDKRLWVLEGRKNNTGHKRAGKKRKLNMGHTKSYGHHGTENDYVPISPHSSQIGPSVYPRTHTHNFPNWMLSNYNTTEPGMIETNDLHVLPSEMEAITETTGRNEPDGLSLHVTPLQAPNAVEHSLWSNTDSTSQGGAGVIHNAFMGNDSIVSLNELCSLESTSFMTFLP